MANLAYALAPQPEKLKSAFALISEAKEFEELKLEIWILSLTTPPYSSINLFFDIANSL